MKIVVTGAAGHIGSFVVRDLATQFPGTEIIMLDNMMTQRFCSLFDLPHEARYRFIEADVTKIDLRPVFEGTHTVVHLAAITEAAGSFHRAEEVEANNYQATLKVSEACLATGARLFAPSSTSVYGTTKSLVAEDCSPAELNPQSPYAATKLKEERLIQGLCRTKGLRAISCRFGTIFGVSQGMRFHTAVNKFCWQAVMGLPLTVWRTAIEQKRAYLDLIDASRAIAFIIREELFDGRVYNVLTLNTTVRDIIETIREFVPGIHIDYVDHPIMNEFSYEVSCERFIKAGFKFCGELKRGVRDTVALLRWANSN